MENNTKINVLGTEYTIEICKIDDCKKLKENKFSGICISDEPLIIIADRNDDKYFDFASEEAKQANFKETLRHEIIHAFLNESGLKECSNEADGWARNEEMVDWIAIQFPKILKVYEQLGIL
jgi:hypothetical protein